MTIANNPKLIKKLEEVKFVEENLCEANKLLIKRMKSNPDEFHLYKGGKWADYLNMIYSRLNGGDDKILVALSTEECQYIWDKYTETSKHNLHTEFMKRILDSGEPTEDTGKVRFSTTSRYGPYGP